MSSSYYTRLNFKMSRFKVTANLLIHFPLLFLTLAVLWVFLLIVRTLHFL